MKVENERQTFGKCPACGGDIIEGEKSFYCSNVKKPEEGGKDCKVHVAKLLMGQNFSKSMVRELFEKLETPVYDGITKEGEETRFKLVWDAEKKEIIPDYVNDGEPQKPLGKCPKCGKDVFIGKKSYFCAGYKDEPKCDWSLFKETSGAKFTPGMVRDLLAGKELEDVVCFSKEGNEYKCGFKISGDVLKKITYGGQSRVGRMEEE